MTTKSSVKETGSGSGNLASSVDPPSARQIAAAASSSRHPGKQTSSDAILEYAAEQGVVLTPHSISRIIKQVGRDGIFIYIDKLGEIMDAASALRVTCTQASAIRRLSGACGDSQRVIASFAAECRRRSDRAKARCRSRVPPRDFKDRTNAYAGCGCPRCCERLAATMTNYIGKVIATPFFSNVDKEEARGEAHLALIEAVETWPGGNFTGWFSACLINRIRKIYRSRLQKERETVSLDADHLLSEDDKGHRVPLAERIPDRTRDVLTIVILREQIVWPALELLRIYAERATEYEAASLLQHDA